MIELFKSEIDPYLLAYGRPWDRLSIREQKTIAANVLYARNDPQQARIAMMIQMNIPRYSYFAISNNTLG